jgi:biotin synthase
MSTQPANRLLSRADILELLTAEPPLDLFSQADRTRREACGDEPQRSALLVYSNHCHAPCHVCDPFGTRREIERFRLSRDEMVRAATQAARDGMRTILLQAGEDWRFGPEIVASAIAGISQHSELAVTVAMGQFHAGAYALWRAAGAQGYMLKFETSQEARYRLLRPGRSLREIVGSLRTLRDLGYRLGSGNLVGLPEQTLGDLADDLLLMAGLQLDTVDIAPFLPAARLDPSPAERLASGGNEHSPVAARDVIELTLRCVAIARWMLPQARIIAPYSAFGVGLIPLERSVAAGADVLMHPLDAPRRHLRPSASTVSGVQREDEPPA